ncbi:MAG TPA: methionine--tRNA ligase [Vicinamibacterales bacterium]|nr:methionine--tRNA ligase [Vicinamibacterales bacterium]
MKFFLTTAIDYVNSRPHLGTAYEKVTADVIARYKRLAGYDTYFLMGNDEHSQNVFRRAQELGQDPLAYCDEMERVFTAVWRRLDVSNNDFIRTTDARRHRPAVQRMVQACYDAGDIYEGVYEGWYCVGCEAFKQEKDLVDGHCPVHPAIKPEWIREKNWFFRLSKYQKPLLDAYAANPSFIEPEVRRNEILRLVEAGLDDISVSRAGQAWGIPLPFDRDSVVYVWFDALINYAAAVGYGWDDDRFRTWWPANLHVIGKDITRFHCVIWPAMLLSAGVPLPGQVFGHGWISVANQRMSKSLGNVVDPIDAAQRCGVDPLRLYLTKEVPYGGDGDFTFERLDEKYNADLANNLGNLVSRLSAMTNRYRGGQIPAPSAPERLAAIAAQAVQDYRRAMERLALHEGVAAAFRLVDAANLYIADTQPWALARHDAQSERLTQVLAEAAEAVRIAAILLSPVMPSSTAEILRRMGETRTLTETRLSDAEWRTSGERRMLNEGPLWPRKETMNDPRNSQNAQNAQNGDDPQPAQSTPRTGSGATPAVQSGAATPAPESPTAPLTQAAAPTPASAADVSSGDLIAIEDFMKVELRTARIIDAERVPKSKKLMKMRVDVGTGQRTIVAGIAEAYEPGALVGKTVVIVANLKPAKLMGIESNGMVLAASPEGGQPIVLNAEPAEPGTRVR